MNPIDILKKKGLAKTHCRIDILNTLINNTNAFSETELRKKLSYKYDRSTIFRTIRSFLNSGIIHSVSCEGELQYALTTQKEKSPHAHFKCNTCGQTTCISTIKPIRFIMPRGFIKKEISILINGTCKNCRTLK